jgi:hypothetical protein
MTAYLKLVRVKAAGAERTLATTEIEMATWNNGSGHLVLIDQLRFALG